MADFTKDILNQNFWSNSVLDWLVAAGISVAVFLMLWSASALFCKKFKALAEKSENTVDDMILDLLQQTRRLFLLALAVFIGMQILVIPLGAEKLIRSAFVVVLLLQVWFWGAQLLKAMLRALIRRDRSLGDSDSAIEGTMPAIEFVGKLVLFSLILLLALDNFGFDVTALVASLGIGGIAIALALQNVLGDLFASLSILFDKPFRVGDFIVVGDKAGSVEKIGLKTTRVRSLGGEQLVFSNGDLLSSRIQNFKRMNERRIVFSVGVIYSTPPAKLKKIPQMIKQSIQEVDKTRFDRAHFKSFGPSSLDFEVVYFVLSPEFGTYMDIQQEINLKIYERFESEGLEFAFPTQTLFLEKTDSLVESLKNVGT